MTSESSGSMRLEAGQRESRMPAVSAPIDRRGQTAMQPRRTHVPSSCEWPRSSAATAFATTSGARDYDQAAPLDSEGWRRRCTASK